MYKYPKGCFFNTSADIKGKTVTVMGLGLNGGGAGAVKFLLLHGAKVIATDTKSEEELKSTINDISDFMEEKSIDKSMIIYHLNGHDGEDFIKSDCIIKNPIVNIEKNEYLKMSIDKHIPIESDLSLFLNFTKSPIIAVTGSKGKSTTVSAIQFGFEKLGVKSFLGGNITKSPLIFLDETNEETPVILELSSWQLRDLAGRQLLKPAIAVITKIAHDHQNWYENMTEYVRDKALIYADMPMMSSIILDSDEWGDNFALHAKMRHINIYRYDSNSGSPRDVNIGNAATVLKIWGFNGELVNEVLATWDGLPHRMQKFFSFNNIDFFNDSAATIPEATIASLKALSKTSRVILIAGGTDKVLDFSDLATTVTDIYKNGKLAALYLLSGSATNKFTSLLKEKNLENLKYKEYNNLNDLLMSLKTAIINNDLKIDVPNNNNLNESGNKSDAVNKTLVLFSPAATSFEMFTNEFDRGDKFMAAVKAIFK